MQCAEETGISDAVKDQFPAQFGETRLWLDSHTSSLVYSHLTDIFLLLLIRAETTASCTDTSMEEMAMVFNLALKE